MKSTKLPMFVIVFMILVGTHLNAQTAQPLTVAEKSNFKSTSTSAEVIEFIDWCVDRGSHVKRYDYGKTVEGRDMVAVTIAGRPYQVGQKDSRTRVLVIGNIHSGECAGKEALLMMLRELTHNPENGWLKNMVIVLVPNYSADSNDRVGLHNRPGQVGPENGMGRRENAQGLDLNRDFIKLDSPEGRSMVKLIDTVDPHLFVDCHTTNGSRHRYALTYDVPHNPSTAESIKGFLRDRMMPEITRRMEAKGLHTFYYGNFSRDNSKWTTYGHEPRYSTEYVGLRNRLSILSEAYAYITYKERIIATKHFVETILDFVAEKSEEINLLVESVDSNLQLAAATTPERVTMALGAKVTSFEEKCTLLGFKEDQPYDYVCEFVGKYEPTKTSPLPYAYLVPEKFNQVVGRLRMHGIKVERLNVDARLNVEVDTVQSVDRSDRAFQEHKMLRVEATRSDESRAIKAGTYVVRTSQPLGRLASYMLESESDDGFVFWNFFDEAIAENSDYPVLRIAKPIQQLPLSNVTEVPRNRRLSLDDIDGPNELLANYPQAPKWQGKTNFIESKSWGRTLLVDAATMSFVERSSRRSSRGELVAQLRALDIDGDIAQSIATADPKSSDNQQTQVFTDSDYTVVAHKGTVRLVGTPDAPAELVHFNHDESILAYFRNNGLNFLELDTGDTRSIRSDDPHTLTGKLDWVYQEELYGRGNYKGYWMSPTGNQVAFLELDESPVHEFTVVDHIPVRGNVEVTNYPKAGDPLPKVRVAVADASTGEHQFVDLSSYDDTEILISRVGWTADGSKLLIQVQDREQTWLDLIATDALGNGARKMFRDETPAWIESPGDPEFLADGSFVWPSPRNGYQHLYHYSAEGELIGPLTSGEWEVRSFVGIDPAKEYAYFTATVKNPLDVHAYRVRLPDGPVQQLTAGPGTHDVSFSHDFSHFIDNVSTFTEPAVYRIYKCDGTFLRQLNANVDDRHEYFDLPEPEWVQLPAGNDQPLDALIMRPSNFDPAKKYPVLFHIYAGPQSPRVRNRFGGDWYLWHQMLAQQGYVVFMCDNQSASFRGLKNVWPIHRNFAENELADIERGVAWLKQQDWVDAERIGIWGWSYGGYMTAYAMTRSQSFKMGISGAPVTDWKNYDAIYTERYMGTPQNNPEGYEKTSVLPVAGNLHGKLLLIHGTIDDNVHLSNTMQFVYELQKAGKQFELMCYPKNRHSVRDKQQQAHLRKLMTDYVVENL